jgi:hypothetical protein
MKTENLINWREVSRLLCGASNTMYSKKIPLRHRQAIDELKLFLEKWIEKYKKPLN